MTVFKIRVLLEHSDHGCPFYFWGPCIQKVSWILLSRRSCSWWSTGGQIWPSAIFCTIHAVLQKTGKFLINIHVTSVSLKILKTGNIGFVDLAWEHFIGMEWLPFYRLFCQLALDCFIHIRPPFLIYIILASLGIWICAHWFSHTTHCGSSLLMAHLGRRDRAPWLLSSQVPLQRAGPRHNVGQKVNCLLKCWERRCLWHCTFAYLIREDPQSGTHPWMSWVILWRNEMQDTNTSYILFVLWLLIIFEPIL